MKEIVELRGIAWDHPRGYEPLIASAREFSNRNPHVSIKWDVRSLKEFGDMPIEELIGRYDFITIDHPYMGQAFENQLLLKLDEYIDSQILETLKGQSVGPCFQSYFYNNHQLALPIDAAALVAAYRKDLLLDFGITGLPKTRSELRNFYNQLPNKFSVAWPLCPTDFWCAFLTICAQDGGRHFIKENTFNINVGINALEEIKQHLEFIHPESISWNPIQILDRMGKEDEIIYSPFLFGYTNYSRPGYSPNLIHFSNSPVNPETNVSTILGGVGLAVSSQCKEVKTAVEFVSFVAGAEIQEGIYTREGGQPGNIRAWNSRPNNELCNNFFSDTLTTMENAYVRPQHPKWNKFQEQGASLLHEGVLKNIDSGKLITQLNELYHSVIHHG